MKRLLLAVAFLFISTSAFAFGDSESTAVGVGVGIGNAASKSISNANSMSKSISNSSSNATAYQHQYQGQSMNNRNFNKNANNSSGNTTVFKTPHQAPSFGLASMFPTAVCQGTLAAGFSFLLGGGAGAGTITIEECMKIETIRVGTYMLQNAPTTDDKVAMFNANLEVYCKLKHARDTSACPQLDGGKQTDAGDDPKTASAAPSDPFTPERKVKLEDMFSWN